MVDHGLIKYMMSAGADSDAVAPVKFCYNICYY